ncbi:hypothetical protein RF11_07887 [Thelohanellus kitauei]|uniref:Uncharacterized protein n=1 Tax=Thelohanellus kitauei TaxID=669202 RepID=A0A0C2MNK4_THEKT|nr:hypothetical protein RF11_07887 [Thelohanellus kitauei]
MSGFKPYPKNELVQISGTCDRFLNTGFYFSKHPRETERLIKLVAVFFKNDRDMISDSPRGNEINKLTVDAAFGAIKTIGKFLSRPSGQNQRCFGARRTLMRKYKLFLHLVREDTAFINIINHENQ